MAMVTRAGRRATMEVRQQNPPKIKAAKTACGPNESLMSSSNEAIISQMSLKLRNQRNEPSCKHVQEKTVFYVRREGRLIEPDCRSKRSDLSQKLLMQDGVCQMAADRAPRFFPLRLLSFFPASSQARRKYSGRNPNRSRPLTSGLSSPTSISWGEGFFNSQKH